MEEMRLGPRPQLEVALFEGLAALGGRAGGLVGSAGRREEERGKERHRDAGSSSDDGRSRGAQNGMTLGLRTESPLVATPSCPESLRPQHWSALSPSNAQE